MLKSWSARTTKARVPELLRGPQDLRENTPTSFKAGDAFASSNGRSWRRSSLAISRPSASFGCNLARILEGAREKEEDEDSKDKGERDA